MNCRDYVNTTLGQSSIHGFPYIVKRKLTCVEKIFWVITIIIAAYASIDICLNQWYRFRDNPIIYATELTWMQKEFPFAGMTLCSNYTHKPDFDEIIQINWNITERYNNVTYQYYWNFLQILNTLNIQTIDKLKPYEEDETLQNINFVQLLLKMKRRLLEENKQHDEHDSIGFNMEEEQKFIPALTELGLCKTSSELANYTYPYEKGLTTRLERHICNVMNECNTKILNGVGDPLLTMYFHDAADVIVPGQQTTIVREATPSGALTLHLLLEITTAESAVSKLPIAYRRCRYFNENNLIYSQIYTPGLCRLECRIQAAYKMCNCKPYFYTMAPNITICDIKGLLCLQRKKWPESANCQCMSWCKEISYTFLMEDRVADDGTRFEPTVIVKVTFPRMAIKRRVVFSTDQLIVSFGGAVSLFLGASFISVYGLIFLLSKFVFFNFWYCINVMVKRYNKF